MPRIQLLHEHKHRIRRNAVRHYLELANAGFLVGGDVEVSGYEAIRRHGHRAVVVRSRILHMPVDDIRNPHQRVISGGLNVVPVSRSLRHAVELEAEGLIRLAALQKNRSEQQGRLRTFRMTRCGREDFHVVREIREKDLASREHEHIPDKRSIEGRVGCAGNRVQIMPIPFKESARGSSETRTGKHENLAIGLEGRRTIGNVVRRRELGTSRPFSVG